MWTAPKDIDVPETFLQEVGVSNRVGKLLIRRGITTAEKAREFLYPEEYHPASALEIPDLAKGVGLVSKAIREGTKIGVWGDFDVDGQTSTTLLVSAFKELGGDVIFHIPVRATESHGINLPNLQKMLDEGIGLLVTCDTGISDLEAVDYAKKRGVKVVITDHHDLPATLPFADAVINPSILDESHPLFSLPGVGVAYKFIEHLFSVYGEDYNPAKYLDLVALGIVADVAALTGDTRYLLQKGLRGLRVTTRLGMRVLIENAEIAQETLNEEDIGFSLAPRLNALGRLGDANVIVDLLTTSDETQARVIAQQLEGLNDRRKLLTSQVYNAALAQLEEDQAVEKQSVIVLQGREWPVGVIGIVAGRIAETFGKPAVILSIGDDEICRGSARSVEECDITSAISQCSDLLEGFGGHPMAAGMSLRLENFALFKRCLNRAVSAQVGEPREHAPNNYDVLIKLDELSPILLDEINMLAPFGNGNPSVIFAMEDVRLVSQTIVGRTEEHQRLIVEDDQDHRAAVMWWRGAGEKLPKGKFNLVFTIKANHFMGSETLQLEYVDSWVAPDQVVEPAAEIKLEVQDLRLADLRKIAARYEDRPELLIWGEVVRIPGIEMVSRRQLRNAKELLLASLPPSQKVLKAGLGLVRPEKIGVLGLDPEVDELSPFLTRLSGVCKFIVNGQNGRASADLLAGAMGHTEETVKAGLDWLHAKGLFSVHMDGEGVIKLSIIENGIGTGDLNQAEERISFYLEEAKAYRKYLRSLSSSQLTRYIKDLVSDNHG